MRTRIINVILGVILGLSVAIPVLAHKPAAREYPTLLQVTAVQGLGHDDESDMQEGWLVCMRNAHGYIYRVHTDCGDYSVGEYYTCIMDDNGTQQIFDDIVVDMQFVRVDLFEQ